MICTEYLRLDSWTCLPHWIKIWCSKSYDMWQPATFIREEMRSETSNRCNSFDNWLFRSDGGVECNGWTALLFSTEGQRLLASSDSCKKYSVVHCMQQRFLPHEKCPMATKIRWHNQIKQRQNSQAEHDQSLPVMQYSSRGGDHKWVTHAHNWWYLLPK